MNSIESVPSGEVGTDEELEAIAALCAGTVRYITEGDRRYIHMERLNFLVRWTEQQMDALLCLNYPNAAYPTKLYLPANLGLELNWNATDYILAKPWFSWSWRGVLPNQAPLAILAGHLKAFQ
jgi:hypothetical protein